MAKQIIQLKIDVSKIDKKRLYQGQKGQYLTATLFLNDETDKFGNNGMVVEAITKEERDAGHKGTILGNAKIMGVDTAKKSAVEDAVILDDKLPF